MHPAQLGGEHMENLYRIMDKIFDPLPKEIRKKHDKELEMVYYDLQDEDYKRHKYSCYRKLLIKAFAAFILGILFGELLKFF